MRTNYLDKTRWNSFRPRKWAMFLSFHLSKSDVKAHCILSESMCSAWITYKNMCITCFPLANPRELLFRLSMLKTCMMYSYSPLHRFKPSSKIILLIFPRRYFFCGSFMLFLLCVCYAFVRVCLLLPCGHLLGKGWPLGSRLWCLIVSLLLSHW